MNLEQTKAGDFVVISGRWGSSPSLAKVQRTTSTQVIAGGVRFRKINGREVGSSSYSERYASPADTRRVDEMLMSQRIRRAKEKLSAISVGTQNIGEIEAFLASQTSTKDLPWPPP